MQTFVSTTANCARCHNHKFDPIPQTDYYRLQAVFAGVDRADRPYDANRQVTNKREALKKNRDVGRNRCSFLVMNIPLVQR